MSLGGSMEFRVGSVLSRSIRVLRRNAVVFGTLAMLFTWPSLFVSGDTDQDQASAGISIESPTAEFGGFELGATAIIALPFDTFGIAHSIAGFPVTAFFTAWSAVAATVAYNDLRAEREGIGIDDIAAIFD